MNDSKPSEESNPNEVIDRLQKIEKIQKRIKILAPLMVLFVVIISSLEDGLYLSNIVAIIGGVAGLAFATLSYLKPSTTNLQDTLTPKEIKELIDQTFNESFIKNKAIVNTLINTKQIITDKEREHIISKIQDSVTGKLIESEILKLKQTIEKEMDFELSSKQATRTIYRLSQEVQDLAKRGNLNLFIGIVTTISGLIILGYSVFIQPPSTEINAIIPYYAPRISLVLLIEVFAYFFLRLYKQSLNEIKYFQNEITNAEFKFAALSFSQKQNDATIYSKVIEELAKVERNFILTKDQTTVDLERDRISKEQNSSIIEALRDLIKKKDG